MWMGCGTGKAHGAMQEHVTQSLPPQEMHGPASLTAPGCHCQLP